jgi:pimeloyl-ACP methyl ester carboxylesterase
MRQCQRLLMRVLVVVAWLSLAVSAAPLARAMDDVHIEVLKGRFRQAVPDTARGRLAELDGHVVFTPSRSDHDLWRIVPIPPAGCQIQARGGRWDGWVLTADTTGKVHLTPRAERGSVWKQGHNTVGGWNLEVAEPGNPPRALVVADTPSTLTDRDGIKHLVYVVRLQEKGETRAPAELVAQPATVAPPAPGEPGRSESTAGPGRPRPSLVNVLLFHPRRYPEGDWETRDPAIEDVWFKTTDGVRINGWFSEAKHPRAVVLYAEGNAGNITSRRWILKLFRDRMNASVLLFDYRGYGRSEGAPSTSGILDDAHAARHWLADRTGVSETSIVLVGTSLGGAVMADLAGRDGARGLVLENTFSSLDDVAAHHFGPVMARVVVRQQLDSVSRIRDYKGPLLQTHGDADTVIPYELGRRLFEAANEPKQFLRVPGGDHNDPPTRDYLDALERFLNTLPAGR